MFQVCREIIPRPVIAYIVQLIMVGNLLLNIILFF
jgi:hypothetical protein